MTRLLAWPGIALLLATLPDRTPVPSPDPTCTGSLRGGSFTTAYLLRGGYRLEGLWRLQFVETLTDGRADGVAMTAVLQELKESVGRGKPATIPLAEPWRLDITDEKPIGAMNRVVEIWCAAVLAALEGDTRVRWDTPLRPGRVT